MNRYKIADLTIAMESMGDIMSRQAKPYETDVLDKEDIMIRIDEERVENAIIKYPRVAVNEWEYILAGFDFARGLLDFEGFCLHASAVALEGKAVLFSGPCGTGKSTHTGLWLEHFRDAFIINDDKPALRLHDDGSFYVYGTPWSGKHFLNTNVRVPLQAIVFLTQAKENKIRRLDNKEAVQLLMYQSMRPSKEADRMEKLLALLDALLQKTPVYRLECNISREAVVVAYNGIYNEINNIEMGD